LREALVTSCNTVFAPLAVELGGAAVVGMAERAGFNAVLRFELGAAISSIPSAEALDANPAALAQTGLGERDIRVTPLQMALIAGGIANRGQMMHPYVVDRVLTEDGSTLEAASPAELSRIFSAEIGSDLTEMMIGVVEEGTGRAAALPEITVAGKTGTAEGAGGPHAWFIGFAPAADPTIAIAVVVEGGGSGGSVAAPIAREVIEAWLAISE
jgi:peptidoglycan glycosyltransferase